MSALHGTRDDDATVADGETEPGFDSQPPPHEARIDAGQLIDDRYRIEGLLGRGAMGEVHLAEDLRLARQVAIKLVRANSPSTARRFQARLEREALALARVDHPNVVAIHDVGHHDGRTYLTMQYVPGTTLSVWQQQKRTRRELIYAYLQAGRGLAAAHGVGVVHRDFKPDNVIVGADGIVRVLDFGLAAALLPEHSRDSGDSGDSGEPVELGELAILTGANEHMTQAGALLGTLAYMSIEQLEGRTADALSDQFAFCVAMWEALTGKRPFSGVGLFERIQSIERGPSGSFELPRWLRVMLSRGLDPAPGRRWPNIGALCDAIEARRDRTPKILLGIGLPLVVAGAMVLGRALAPADAGSDDDCTHFVAQLDARWTADDRAAITARAQLDGEAANYAIASLDALGLDWQAAATASCEGEAAPPKPARDCLQSWLDSFDGAIELLAERGDDKTFARAPDLLARLQPPGTDYCALAPTQAIDPELWRLVERGRGLAALADFEGARELLEAASRRVSSLDSEEFSGERALVQVLRAQLASSEGRTDAAIEAFAVAQRQALAADYHPVLLEVWTEWAKLLVLSSGASEHQAELALVRVEQAEPLLVSLGVDAHDRRRGELLEARGLAERARDRHDQAIAMHREAQALFEAANLPTMAAHSLVNIGANHQDRGELEAARRSYVEARTLLDAASLPPSYRSRVVIERNLGLLAYEATDIEDIAAGLAHFEFVLAHGSDDERFEAHELILALALELDDAELTRRWAEAALAALAARPQASVAESFRIQRVAGIALAYLGDERGEALLGEAERCATNLPPLMQFNLQLSWIEWLEHSGRCSDAARRRERVAALVADANTELAATHAQWRADGPTADCAPTSPTP